MEKLLDYGDSKFLLKLYDDEVIDPETNNPCQFIVAPDDCTEDLIQPIRIYKRPEMSARIMAAAIACAVDYQYQAFARSKHEDHSCGANDYFWSIEALLQVSSCLTMDTMEFIRQAGLKFLKETVNYYPAEDDTDIPEN